MTTMQQIAGADRVSKRQKGRSRILLATGLWLSFAAAATAADEPKTFRDWMAGCDNIKTCTAISLPPERLHLFDAEGRARSHGHEEGIACAAV